MRSSSASEKISFTLHDSGEVIAEIVGTVPDDWDRVDGWLEPSPALAGSGRVALRSGYSVSPYSSSPLIRGLWNEERREYDLPDLSEMMIAGRLPKFVSFDKAGVERSRPNLAFCRQLAAHYVLLGYRGWLSFSAGAHRNGAHDRPADMTMHFLHARPRHGIVNWQAVITCASLYGGTSGQIASILEACRRLNLAPVEALRNANPAS